MQNEYNYKAEVSAEPKEGVVSENNEEITSIGVWDKPYIYIIISFLLSLPLLLLSLFSDNSKIISSFLNCIERGAPEGLCFGDLVSFFVSLPIMMATVALPTVFVAVAFTKIKNSKNKNLSYWLVSMALVFLIITLCAFFIRNY